MGNIQNYINTKRDDYIDAVKKNLVSIIIAFFISLIYIVDINSNINDHVFIEESLIVLLLALIGSFFIESVISFCKLSNKKIILMAWNLINIIIAIVVEKILKLTLDKYNSDDFSLLVVFIYLAIFLISIFQIYKRSNLKFGEYFARLCFGLLRVLGLILILNIAIVLLLEIASALILEFDIWNSIYNIELILCSLLYFPLCLYKINNLIEKNSKFTIYLIKYILMTCVLIATGIIYIYILKIILFNKEPSNEIFIICSQLFAVGAPIWVMSQVFMEQDTDNEEKKVDNSNDSDDKELDYFEPKGYYKKIVSIMDYIYAPFILLEIYSMGVRIKEYGITEMRYLSVLFIILQIVFIFTPAIYKLINKKKIDDIKKYRILLITFLLEFFVFFNAPFINGNSLSFKSQKNRFEKNLGVDNVKAKGAFDYLNYDFDNGRDYLKHNYTDDELEKFYDIQYDERIKKYAFYNRESDLPIDVKGYSKLYKANSTCEMVYEESMTMKINYKDGIIDDVDAEEICNKLVELDVNKKSNNRNEDEEEYFIIIDDTRKFVLEDSRVVYNEDTLEILEYTLNGYILEK